MCGIAGIFAPDLQKKVLEDRAVGMADALKHRGPDDAGVWVHDQVPLAFSHRRLSILDLSEQGHQPMRSASGALSIVYNGEVYNFGELSKDLEKLGASFRGHSDTEVILSAIEHWGLEKAVARFRGMFAFALWDEESQTLTLVRDRIGIKPLYYGWGEGRFVFSSELRSLRKGFNSRPALNLSAAGEFFRHCYIPDPYSIYEGVFKLLPGSFVRLSREQLDKMPANFSPGHDSHGNRSALKQYWDFREVVERGQGQCSLEEATIRVQEKFEEAVQLRLVSDVPIGAFLSGGIDSSLVVAAMQKQLPGNVRTYSIGFDEEDFNEAPYAAAIARHLGTEHCEMIVSSTDALNLVPEIAGIYDEPFADSSQIPTVLLSRLTREHVTVALSGDGGDELFGGYERYSLTQKIEKIRSQFPQAFRSVAAAAYLQLPRGLKNIALGIVRP